MAPGIWLPSFFQAGLPIRLFPDAPRIDDAAREFMQARLESARGAVPMSPSPEAAQGASRPGEPEYTMSEALDEAMRLLEAKFGDVEQEAAVALASALLAGHARAQFMHRESEPGGMPYGT